MATPDNTDLEKSAQVKAESKDGDGKSSADGNGKTGTGGNGKDSAEAAKDADDKDGDKGAKSKDDGKEKKPVWTWERSIEIVKLVATVWVALLGSVVSMQFNERQHELNRIEAIAQMLPHMSESGDPKKGGGDHMARDGAIWAVFRTANNRTMLRDLASLFPEDIYRVVSSIALAGQLDHDADAIVALQVASEKLAAEYSLDPKKAELASRLYAQALTLKERQPDDTTPLRVVDLTATVQGTDPSDDQLAGLIKGINNLADVHLTDSDNDNSKKKSGASHWASKQLYLRARQLGIANKDEQVQIQVMRADLSLAKLYARDQLADDTFKYLKEALTIEEKFSGKANTEYIKELDKDGDGFAALADMSDGIKRAQDRLKLITTQYQDKGASIKETVSEK